LVNSDIINPVSSVNSELNPTREKPDLNPNVEDWFKKPQDLNETNFFLKTRHFFCFCRICKINSKDGNGRVLSTKKTFRKHQKKKKKCIEESDETESDKIESSNESISSCNVAEKRKFEDELDELDESDESDESDINSSNSPSDNDSIPLISEDRSKR